MINKKIVEKQLGIPADYQFKAINSPNFIQANWHKNKIFAIKSLVEFNNKMSVLDMGTGSGNFEILFADKVESITGIDYNDEALAFLNTLLNKKGLNNVNLILSDIRNLPKNKLNKKFDLILLIDVIEHLKYKDVTKLFTTFSKLLKRGGKVLIITPNYRGLWPIIEDVFDFFGITPKFKEHQHLSKLYKKNLLELIGKNNYRLERVTTFNLFSYLFPSKRLAELLCSLEFAIPYPIGNLIAVVFSKS